MISSTTAIIIAVVCSVVFLAIGVVVGIVYRKKVGEAAIGSAEEKAKSDAELEAVKARQTQLEESTLNQEKLLSEIKDILSKK